MHVCVCVREREREAEIEDYVSFISLYVCEYVYMSAYLLNYETSLSLQLQVCFEFYLWFVFRVLRFL